MNFYVIQVKTGGEARFIRMAERKFASLGIDKETAGTLVWPRRKLTIRKQGVRKESLAPIFPGYVFLRTEILDTDVFWSLRRTSGFYRFLRDNRHVEPLGTADERLITHFLSFGEVVEKSRVVYDENQKIRVVDGPMKGLEGRIVKVDKRKGRAKIELTLYEDAFLIDFGFEVLEPAGKDENTAKE